MGQIVSSDGLFAVGINPGSATEAGGNLFDGSLGVGFLRRAPGAYDPVAQGTARESWGVSAGSVGGYVDPIFSIPTTLNLVPDGPIVFSGSSAVGSFLLSSGGTTYLRITQTYTFVANNVLRITTQIVNSSGASQEVKFRRLVDWDVDPSFSEDVVNFPENPPGSPVSAFSRAQWVAGTSANPLVALPATVSPPAVFGPDDQGESTDYNFGTLAAGDTVSFDYYYAISRRFQTPAQFAQQLTDLGLEYIIHTTAPTINTESAAVCFPMPVAPPPPCCPCIGTAIPCSEAVERDLIPNNLFGIVSGGACSGQIIRFARNFLPTVPSLAQWIALDDFGLAGPLSPCAGYLTSGFVNVSLLCNPVPFTGFWLFIRSEIISTSVISIVPLILDIVIPAIALEFCACPGPPVVLRITA